MDEIARRVFCFGEFTIDVVARTLHKGQDEVRLRPKSFDVLLCLVKNAGRTIAKDEIIESVWADVTVTDESLTRCISDVRAALGDDQHRLIKTISGRGYLLAATASDLPSGLSCAVQIAVPSSTVKQDPERHPPLAWLPRKYWHFGAAAALALLVAAFLHGPWRQLSMDSQDRPSIAVLPFSNAEGTDQDYFSDGITEDLTTSLSKFADLLVIARSSAFQYKAKLLDVKQVGRILGARYLLQGSVRRDDKLLRITAQLVDTASGKEIWAESYDRPLTSVFALQDELTQKIVITLVSRIDKSELARTLGKPPNSLAAYDYYLRGHALMGDMESENSTAIVEARRLFEQALAVEPHYARAMQALAYTIFLSWGDPGSPEFGKQQVFDRAIGLAEKAVELDETLPEAHATLGWMRRWQGATQESFAEFERAIALNPNFVDGRYGLLLAHGGRPHDAIEYLRRIMRLDPLYPPSYTYWIGKSYFFLGEYDTAIEFIEPAAAAMPDHRPSHALLAAVSAYLGRGDEARRAASDLMRIDPKFTITSFVKILKLARQEDADRLSVGLRKAGLPD
jgi:adenylate cyclase